MVVLGVDTTTREASVAVAGDGAIIAELRLTTDTNSSSTLLPAVESLLERVELVPGDIDGFAVTTGPGSFTGLRVGLSTIQGMALGLGRPALGISALDVLAARIVGDAGVLVAMMNAYRGEVFGGIYDAEARLVSERTVGSVEALLGELAGAPAFIGEAAETHREQIRVRLPEARFSSRSRYLAGTLARMAELRLEAGEGVDAAALRPLYIREAEIGKPRK